MDTYSRAVAYLDKLDPAVSGSHGHDQTLRAACELFRFGLSSSDAWQALQGYNARCQPPWKEHELRHKLADAEKIVRASGRYAMRAPARSTHRRTFQAPPPPVRRPKPLPPVIERSEAEEDAWWADRAAEQGMTLDEFDAYCDGERILIGGDDLRGGA